MISPSAIAGYTQHMPPFFIPCHNSVASPLLTFQSHDIHVGEMEFSILASDPRSRPKKPAPKKVPTEPTEKPKK